MQISLKLNAYVHRKMAGLLENKSFFHEAQFDIPVTTQKKNISNGNSTTIPLISVFLIKYNRMILINH